jgi:hypothetical protein
LNVQVLINPCVAGVRLDRCAARSLDGGQANAAKTPKPGANLVAASDGQPHFFLTFLAGDVLRILAAMVNFTFGRSRPSRKIRRSAVANSMDFGSTPRLAALKVKAVLPKIMAVILAPQAHI